MFALVDALATVNGLNIQLSIGSLFLSVAPTSVPADRPVDEMLRNVDRFGVLKRMFEAKVGVA